MNRKYMDQIHKIYDEYFDDVYKYVLAMSKDPSLSEKITQETFFKAIKNLRILKVSLGFILGFVKLQRI